MCRDHSEDVSGSILHGRRQVPEQGRAAHTPRFFDHPDPRSFEAPGKPGFAAGAAADERSFVRGQHCAADIGHSDPAKIRIRHGQVFE